MPNASNTGAGYPEGYQPATGTLAAIINNSVATGLSKWGFVIFRGVYGDNEEWDKFLSLYKAAVADELLDFGLEQSLGQHHEWTVIEDPTTLDGVPKAAVRSRFMAWVEERRAHELQDRPWAMDLLPRYKFCLYMDKTCLNTITARLHGGRMVGEQWALSSMGSVIIIDGLHQDQEPEDEEEEEDFDEGYSEIEGSTNYNVGWAYIDVLGYAELYAKLSSGGSHSSIWDGMVYRGRRPEVDPQPNYNYGQPLSAIPSNVPFGRRIQH